MSTSDRCGEQICKIFVSNFLRIQRAKNHKKIGSVLNVWLTAVASCYSVPDSSRSGVATLRTAIHLLLTNLLTYCDERVCLSAIISSELHV